MKIVHAKEPGYDIYIDKSDFTLDIFVAVVFSPSVIPSVTEQSKRQRQLEQPILMPESVSQRGMSRAPMKKFLTVIRHVIGPVWMRFNADQLGQSGLGIHGYTGEGEATGVLASNGCIRMANHDARELYNILVPCGMYQSGSYHELLCGKRGD